MDSGSSPLYGWLLAKVVTTTTTSVAIIDVGVSLQLCYTQLWKPSLSALSAGAVEKPKEWEG